MTDTTNLLTVNHLVKKYPVRNRGMHKEEFYALNDVTIKIGHNEVVGLIGESGCGKSTLGRIIVKLLDATDGQVLFRDQDISKMSNKDFSNLRHKIQMIFQDPNGVLNPRFKIRKVFDECLRAKGIKDEKERTEIIMGNLGKVGLNESYLSRYPHELSGGQKQRIAILLALLMEPELIVADEVVSALDVSVQSQILNLLKELQTTSNLSYLFISHDLNVVYHISDRIIVMYLGEIVEEGSADDIFHHHKHPYTKMLFESSFYSEDESATKNDVVGEISDSMNDKAACKFYSRCVKRCDKCKSTKPERREIQQAHFVQCHCIEEA
ncbi:ABC transporter ATP-binding protein [Anaerorhabdus sp.]|uniref:ABC transporter ATP-binding protein n=1 Tax=Anaerorhabdus sp. TaxID=1872524 RepID=UPI002FCBF3F6